MARSWTKGLRNWLLFDERSLKEFVASFFFFLQSAQIVNSINISQIIPFLLVLSIWNIYFFTVSQWIPSTKDWRQKEKRAIEESITDSVDINLSKLKETVEDRGTCLLSMGSQSWAQHSDWTIITWYQSSLLWSSQIKLFSWKGVYNFCLHWGESLSSSLVAYQLPRFFIWKCVLKVMSSLYE